MADSDESQRVEELGWVKFAWQHHPGAIPVGDGTPEQLQPPAPDLVITSSGRRYGVEVSQLTPSAYAGVENLKILAAQRSYLESAQRMHEASNPADTRLFANFSFRPGPLPTRKTAVRDMVDLVERYRPEPGKSFEALPGQAATAGLLPDWLVGLCVFHPSPDFPLRWVGGSVWSTKSLSRVQVAERIKQKSLRLTEYRRFADEVWLLLVVNQVPIGEDISVPRDAIAWQFEHDFDRVLLLSQQELLTFQ
ncbi:hypothetical protein [Pseudoxanthomonas japonensis]|uniref:hypothetical protein n=1 Tax=Pseudoxanthomonas japonensis TaxID=69284 RepID=UPI001BCB025E|nr:hypothetical protein [Pseudoxanthomonas japonensis]